MTVTNPNAPVHGSSADQSSIASLLLRASGRAVAAADRLDARWDRSTPHPVAAAWGLVRLASTLAVSPALGPLVALIATRNTKRAHELAQRYPAILEAIATGRSPTYDNALVVHAPARARWFISSDLHRCAAGSADWPRLQRTGQLYEVALDHYASKSWGLIENGDIEDFWLAGGSVYGAAYDVTNLLAHLLGDAACDDVVAEVAIAHLARIVANNQPIYDRIESDFNRHGRYRRTIGNHDDVLAMPGLRDAIGRLHDGVEVADFVVLDGDDELEAACGIVTHGHHTDAWNAPRSSGIGRLGTWLGSALADAPGTKSPDLPDRAWTDRLLAGRQPDVLTTVSRVLGVNRALDSLDEEELLDVARRHAANGGLPFGFDGGPYLVCGHTHIPLVRPLDLSGDAAWSRYANSGAGVFHECVTGLEWDGTRDPRNPEVSLVVWRYADREPRHVGDAIAVAADGRPVVREVLTRDATGPHLRIDESGYPFP